MRLHPATQILTWCVLVMVTQTLSPALLIPFASVILLASLPISGRKFMHLLQRTRWIMFSLLLIYALSTPGAPVLEGLGIFSPTREGVADGLHQILRLLVALAGLAMLLDRLHRHHLIAGLHALLWPLRWLGLSPERAAVRLALTLHYAEAAMLRARGGWRETLDGLLEPHGEPARQIPLPHARFGIADMTLLLVLLSFSWLAWR